MRIHPAEIHVWLARGINSRAALAAVLGRYTESELQFDRGPHGKPCLLSAPEIRFNLSHSSGVLLVAVTLDVEIGVDIERFRPLPDCLGVAGRFFPPDDAAALAAVPAAEREREFFTMWTRTEAKLKARGVGLYGAGEALDGEWTVAAIDAGDQYAAAVAAERSGMTVTLRQA